MNFGIITLFPNMFYAITNYGIVGKAYKNGLIKVKIWNPRDYTKNKNRTVDKKPYGGGSGLLMMVEPLRKTIKLAALEISNAKIIYLSPKGKTINQKIISRLYSYKKLILICGRYKGIDERIITNDIHEELSIGDYIVSGGELPTMILIDAISRLIPGVLSKKSSITENSFFNNLLDCPHYTKPIEIEKDKVPSLLLSGNHEKIRKWRLKQSLGITWLKRPDLLEKVSLTQEQEFLLSEFLYEFYQNKLSTKL